MNLKQAIQMLEAEYEKAQLLRFVKKPLAWALYRVWRKADGQQVDEISPQPVAPHLMPMGAITYAVACSLCRNKGSGFCRDCICEIRSGFEPNPDAMERLTICTGDCHGLSALAMTENREGPDGQSE